MGRPEGLPLNSKRLRKDSEMRKIFLIIAVFSISLIISHTSQAQITRSLVFAMTFEEGRGDVIHDVSGYGNHGSVIGNSDWSVGQSGSGFHLDGQTHIVVPNAEPLSSLSHPMSVGCWVNPDELGGWRSVVEMDKEDVAGGWKIGFHDSRAVVWTTYRVKDFIGTTPVNTGEWTHIAATWDGAEAIVYVNGKPDAPIAGGGVIDVKDVPSLDIGWRRTTESSFYLGHIDDVFVYSKVLSEEEVNDLMNGLSTLGVEPPGKIVTTWGILKQ
jgi:hypothetical protein